MKVYTVYLVEYSDEESRNDINKLSYIEDRQMYQSLSYEDTVSFCKSFNSVLGKREALITYMTHYKRSESITFPKFEKLH